MWPKNKFLHLHLFLQFLYMTICEISKTNDGLAGLCNWIPWEHKIAAWQTICRHVIYRICADKRPLLIRSPLLQNSNRPPLFFGKKSPFRGFWAKIAIGHHHITLTLWTWSLLWGDIISTKCLLLSFTGLNEWSSLHYQFQLLKIV